MGLINELRLLAAEWLIGMAVRIAPPRHPDSIRIAEAALHAFGAEGL